VNSHEFLPAARSISRHSRTISLLRKPTTLIPTLGDICPLTAPHLSTNQPTPVPQVLKRSCWPPDLPRQIAPKFHGLSDGDFPINFSRNAFASTQVRCTGKLPKRPKGSDCKSAVIDFVGSNPSLATKAQSFKTGPLNFYPWACGPINRSTGFSI
jgi:hypothetical protein